MLYIKSIDRLGRDYAAILNQWRILTKEKHVDIVVIDMPILDTRQYKDLLGTFINDLILQILSYVAETGRATIRHNQAEGIKSAKMRGVIFGRPVKKPPKNFLDVVTRWERGELRTKEVLKQLNLTESTFYRRYREHKAAIKK